MGIGLCHRMDKEKRIGEIEFNERILCGRNEFRQGVSSELLFLSCCPFRKLQLSLDLPCNTMSLFHNRWRASLGAGAAKTAIIVRSRNILCGLLVFIDGSFENMCAHA